MPLILALFWYINHNISFRRSDATNCAEQRNVLKMHKSNFPCTDFVSQQASTATSSLLSSLHIPWSCLPLLFLCPPSSPSLLSLFSPSALPVLAFFLTLYSGIWVCDDFLSSLCWFISLQFFCILLGYSMAGWWIGISGSGMSSLLLSFPPPSLLFLPLYFSSLSTFSPSLLSLFPLSFPPLSCLSPALPLLYFFLLTSVLYTDILPLLILCTSFLHLLVYRSCQLITF